MKIVITSEMRVGSRWLHYLLADLYVMNVSPEVDKGIMDERLPLIRQYMQTGRIAKFHHATQNDILDVVLPIDYKIIGVVRNPRDRVVSKAFHMRYNREGKPVNFDSDLDAVDKCVKEDYFNMANSRQLSMMPDGHSTRLRNNFDFQLPYIWTSYEWMKEDIIKEVGLITEFLGVHIPESNIVKVCERHDFKNKSGREIGKEKRNDRWRRKGVIGDWINWFTVEHLELTHEPQIQYWRKLLRNKGE